MFRGPFVHTKGSWENYCSDIIPRGDNWEVVRCLGMRTGPLSCYCSPYEKKKSGTLNQVALFQNECHMAEREKGHPDLKSLLRHKAQYVTLHSLFNITSYAK